MTSPTGGAIVQNTGQEVVVTQSIPTANTPTFTTCSSADPNVSCRVIGQTTGAVTLGITAAAGATHGTHVVRLKGAAGTAHIAVAEDFTAWPTVQVTPSHITEGTTTRVGISGWPLRDACGSDGGCVGIPNVCVTPQNVNASFATWNNGTLYEDLYAGTGSRDSGGSSHQVTVDLCSVSWNLDALLGTDSPTSCVAGPGAVTVDAPPPSISSMTSLGRAARGPVGGSIDVPAGQQITGLVFTAPKGARLKVHINDPDHVLPQPAAKAPAPLEPELQLILKGPDGLFRRAQFVSHDASGRNYQTVVPLKTPLTLKVSSTVADVFDGNGKQLHQKDDTGLQPSTPADLIPMTFTLHRK